MTEMFYNATAFDQYIGGWAVGSGTSLTSMFSGAAAMIYIYTGVTGFDTTPTLAFFNQ